MEFPYKRTFIIQTHNELFDNLTKYTPTLLHSHWKHCLPYTFHNKFGESYLLFDTSEHDYWNINILTDLFVEAVRLKCVVSGFDSVHDLWHKNKKLQTEVLKLTNGSKDPRELREALYSIKWVKECSLYKPTLAYTFIKYFNAKKVLDLSAGWGDRLLGAMAAGVQVYHGYDPNMDMKEHYNKMIDMFKKDNQDIRVMNQPMDEVNVLTEYYDLFHTSPPFFDKEIYSLEKTQSTSKYKTLDDWLTLFLFEYVKKGWAGLIKGGTFTIYIADTPTIKICDKMNDYIMKELQGTYMGAIGLKSGNRIFPCWCWKKY